MIKLKQKTNTFITKKAIKKQQKKRTKITR